MWGTVYIRDGERYYRAQLTVAQAQRWNNYAMVSIGLVVGEDGFTKRALDGLVRSGAAVEVSHDEWNHSGCQSACTRRGARECRW